MTAFWEEEDRQTFDYNRKGGVAQVGQSLDDRTTLIYRYLYQDTNVFNIEVPPEEIDRQFRTYTVSGPTFSVGLGHSRRSPRAPAGDLLLLGPPALRRRPREARRYMKGFFQAANIRRVRANLALRLLHPPRAGGHLRDEASAAPAAGALLRRRGLRSEGLAGRRGRARR